MVLQELLMPLQEIDGYQASAIFNLRGEVITKHNASGHDIDKIGAIMACLTENCCQSLMSINLGRAKFIQIDSELGMLLEMWVWDKEAILVALYDKDSSLGLIKTKMQKVCQNGLRALLPG